MSKGFVVAEQGHVVQMISPQDFSAAGTSDTILMENWGHVTFICNFGVGSATTISVGECTSFAGSDRTAVTFRYALEATAAGDVLDAALAWSSTVTITSAGVSFAVIEIDADELTDGYPYLQVNIADPGGSKLAGIMAILSGGRYQEDITATVIV